jgi:hypothetical protein
MPLNELYIKLYLKNLNELKSVNLLIVLLLSLRFHWLLLTEKKYTVINRDSKFF